MPTDVADPLPEGLRGGWTSAKYYAVVSGDTPRRGLGDAGVGMSTS
jgi:hypothetical protein